MQKTLKHPWENKTFPEKTLKNSDQQEEGGGGDVSTQRF